MATKVTSSEYFRVSPRATQIGTNRMQASNTGATVTMSASVEYWMFPLPPVCYITGGAIKGSVPSGTIGNTIVQIGTQQDGTLIATLTVSGTAVLSTRFTIISPITVSSSDDLSPYQQPVIIKAVSQTSDTASVSFYLLLEYVVPGMLP